MSSRRESEAPRGGTSRYRRSGVLSRPWNCGRALPRALFSSNRLPSGRHGRKVTLSPSRIAVQCTCRILRQRYSRRTAPAGADVNASFGLEAAGATPAVSCGPGIVLQGSRRVIAGTSYCNHARACQARYGAMRHRRVGRPPGSHDPEHHHAIRALRPRCGHRTFGVASNEITGRSRTKAGMGPKPSRGMAGFARFRRATAVG